MDIQKFQQKLTEVCELGEKNGKVLKPEQIKECFGELDLDKSQLIKILQYLKLKGISIEGAEEISAASQTGPEEVSEEKEEKVPLTAEEEAYLKEYLEGLEEQEQGERSAEELFELLSKGDALAQAELSQKYLRAAAEMAVEMNCEEIFIADLIQEANISLLMALGEEEPEEKDEKWTAWTYPVWDRQNMRNMDSVFLQQSGNTGRNKETWRSVRRQKRLQDYQKQNRRKVPSIAQNITEPTIDRREPAAPGMLRKTRNLSGNLVSG